MISQDRSAEQLDDNLQHNRNFFVNILHRKKAQIERKTLEDEKNQSILKSPILLTVFNVHEKLEVAVDLKLVK